MTAQALLLAAIIWLSIWVMDWIDPPVHADLIPAAAFAVAAFVQYHRGKQ